MLAIDYDQRTIKGHSLITAIAAIDLDDEHKAIVEVGGVRKTETSESITYIRFSEENKDSKWDNAFVIEGDDNRKAFMELFDFIQGYIGYQTDPNMEG